MLVLRSYTQMSRFSCKIFGYAVTAMLSAALSPAASVDRPLLVLSIDGLDHRYLRDCDKLNLNIPNLRRLMKEGELASGVIGIAPTVTWPSHTTMITGVRADQHGILSNRRPASEGGEYYNSANLLKVRTLWHAARDRGLKTAAITWPVTVDADLTYNLPEFFRRRNGGGMDLASIEEEATPGLVDRISRMYPSFATEWMDDRTRALATMYFLRVGKPDLTLVHFVDLDSAAHDNGPFTREANAILEYTDELLGQILKWVPKEMVVAIVSDHGFERIDRVANLNILLARQGMPNAAYFAHGLALTRDPKAAEFLRKAAEHPAHGIGREVPKSELARFAPDLADAAAAFESAPHVIFGAAVEGEYFTKPRSPGHHGLWPLRQDYRSVFLLWGNGVKPMKTPEMDMLQIAARFAEILNIPFQPGEPAGR